MWSTNETAVRTTLNPSRFLLVDRDRLTKLTVDSAGITLRAAKEIGDGIFR
jgi:hypothetical protein